MKLTTTLTALCVSALVAASTAYSQDPAAKGSTRFGHQRWGKGIDRMAENLNLTPEQREKIKPILDQARPQIAAIRQESRQKIKAIQDNVRGQIRPLLTPAQQEKFDAIQKAREAMEKARQQMRDATKS